MLSDLSDPQEGGGEAHRGAMYADQRDFERKAEASGNAGLLGPSDSARRTLLFYRPER